MLDVHPPHQTVHTWRDFFIHVATICVGLLIAIGLEQTVEFFHHRHQVAETRAALRDEKQENIRLYHENVDYHIMTMAYLHNNLRIFLYLRDHPRTPQEKLPGILYWPIFTQRPQETAWSTAGQTGVLELMPRAEVSSIAATYANLDYAWQTYQPVVPRSPPARPTSLRRPTSPNSRPPKSPPRSTTSSRPSPSKLFTAICSRSSAGSPTLDPLLDGGA